MNVWWREQPLTAPELALFEAILSAHATVAGRGNISANAVAHAAQGSGRYTQAIAAALMTLGDKHGPLEEVSRFLTSAAIGTERLTDYIRAGNTVPGWGNAFVKGTGDPAFDDVADLLEAHWPELSARIDSVTQELHRAGKRVYPNPAAFTAASGIALGLPPAATAYLFVLGRLGAWSQIFTINRSKMSWV